MIIKGRTIGEGRPLICVPVMGTTHEIIVKQIRELVANNASMIEWRIDVFEEVESPEAILAVLDEIRELTKNTILVYTYRSSKQGGQGDHSQHVISEVHRIGAESDVVDLVDVEYFVSDKSADIIKEFQEKGAKIIASHHDFGKTPEEDNMKHLLDKMHKGGADVVKLAVMPKHPADVLLLLKVTEEFHREHPDTPLITMSMGALGALSRICGQLSGSCVTFGAGEISSAPGQLPFTKLDELIKLLEY